MTSLRQGPGSMMTSLIHAAAGNFPYCLLPTPSKSCKTEPHNERIFNGRTIA